MSELKTYQVPFAYEKYGYVTVEANTILDAYSKAVDKIDKMTISQMEEISKYLEFSEEIDIDGITRDEKGNIVEE